MFVEHEKQIPKAHQKEKKKKQLSLSQALLKKSKRRKILLGYPGLLYIYNNQDSVLLAHRWQTQSQETE